MDFWKKRTSTIEAEEESRYAKGAALCKEAFRLRPERKNSWLPYKEDVERIIHSKAFKRYSDKTQVVYLVENDHLTHRGVHVQLVSSFSRAVARLLGLNVDLVEAIALGHDVGHSPFGHEGEGYLSEICRDVGLGAFSHSSQSCRLLSDIEPLNLSFHVYDGFLCHDGGMKKSRIHPAMKKSVDEHFAEIALRRTSPEKDLAPASLEGCLVKMCDSVSYLAKDIEDAIHLGIIKRRDVPKTCLGVENREILQKAAIDMVEKSLNHGFVGFSEEVFEALKKLRAFNFERIYTYPVLKLESAKIKRAYRQLFELILEEYRKAGTKSHLHKNFLHSRSKEYLEQTTELQMVVDYIAGMTDRYFVSTLDSFVIPQTIILNSNKLG